MSRMKSLCDISRFEERDIDLLLAEELRVNPEFSRWFVEKGGGSFICNHPATSVDISVVEDGSEADVAALYRDARGQTYRVFVENKITAKKMPEQLERYIRRAQNEMNRGEILGWSVILFTPSGYWDRHCPKGVRHISFEQAADFLRRDGIDFRKCYKADFLEAASIIRGQQARDDHNISTKPFIREFSDTVYDRLEERFPSYFVHKTRYPATVYFAPETHDFPTKLLRVDFKGHKGEVDLAFKNVNSQKLSEILRDFNDIPGKIIFNKKSTSIRIFGLPKFVISDGISIIDTHVIPAYEATHCLIEFWKKHESQLRKAFDK